MSFAEKDAGDMEWFELYAKLGVFGILINFGFVIVILILGLWSFIRDVVNGFRQKRRK